MEKSIKCSREEIKSCGKSLNGYRKSLMKTMKSEENEFDDDAKRKKNYWWAIAAKWTTASNLHFMPLRLSLSPKIARFSSFRCTVFVFFISFRFLRFFILLYHRLLYYFESSLLRSILAPVGVICIWLHASSMDEQSCSLFSLHKSTLSRQQMQNRNQVDVNSLECESKKWEN